MERSKNENQDYVQEEHINLLSTEGDIHQLGKSVYFFLKRIFDVFFAILGIIILVPVYIVTKISYVITGDFNSVFYKQKRVGKHGKIIYIIKLRSMVYNADDILKELLKNPLYKEEWDKNQKLENDPRITKVGKFLRKSSLDELPQFVNVLKGDMSLIGPRPLVVGELDAHGGNHQLYESVKPGISGWWAANGRSATTYEKRLELEYYYCKNCSLWLDIKCIYLTIYAVLSKKGVM